MSTESRPVLPQGLSLPRNIRSNGVQVRENTAAIPGREVPSATTLKTPCTCFASNCQPEDNSNAPRKRINARDRGSLPPRHSRTHATATSLPPRNKPQSPVADG